MNKKRHSLFAIMPSITDVAFVMPLIWAYIWMDGAKTMLRDGDTGWHIRAGDWILANGAVPKQDMFSFTRSGEPWFAWEWLWDAAFAWLHQIGGLQAVVLTSFAIVCLTFALLYSFVRRHCGNALVAMPLTLCAMGASTIHWHARPHLLTLALIVVFLWVLERNVEAARPRVLWVLPALMILWTNLHGGFLAGIIICGAYATGQAARAISAESWRVARAKIFESKPYWITTALCMCATFINPYGYELHTHIAKYLSDPYLFEHIGEFKSLSFQHPSAIYFEILLFLGVIASYRYFAQMRLTYVFLILGWGHLALISARNIPIFTIVAAPFIARALVDLLEHARANIQVSWFRGLVDGFQQFAADMTRLDVKPRWHVASVGAFVLLALVSYAAPTEFEKFDARYNPGEYPEAALKVLAELGDDARVFTHDEWGDYLIYRMYPSQKVFVDGRSDFYGAEFGERYIGLMQVKPSWEATLHDSRIERVILPDDAALSAALRESTDWEMTYADATAVIFDKRNLERESLGSKECSEATGRRTRSDDGCRQSDPVGGELFAISF